MTCLSMSACAHFPKSLSLRISSCKLLFKRQQVGSRSQLSVCPHASRDAYEPDALNEGCPVPQNQQPIFELKQLQEEELFKWAELPLPQFLLRLAFVYIGMPSS